jgi:HPt (histidine-containing phosphotransfer) domain-containing protein
MESDQQECLAAGMDDYISKPFNIQDLTQALKKCRPQQRNSEDEESSPDEQGNAEQANSQLPITSPQLSILDPAAIEQLQATLGTRAASMLPALIESFFKDAVTLQKTARQAIAQRQAEDLRRAVHTLKSNSKNFGALTLARLCQELENQAKNGEFEGADEILTQIEVEYTNVQVALETLRKQI